MFKKGSGKKNLVGLDIGSSAVKAVELSKKGSALQLLNLGFENLQTDTIVDGQIMELNNVSNVISHIFSEHQIRTNRVAAGVSGHSVIVKNIVLPQMSTEELQESFSWHAEEHIPFDIADVNLDYELTGKSSETLHVLMAACKSDKIANVKQAIQLAGTQPGDSSRRQAAGDHRRRRVRAAELLRDQLPAKSRRGRCATQHRRRDDEHQHPERLAFSVRARRFSRRQQVHESVAEGTRIEFRASRRCETGDGIAGRRRTETDPADHRNGFRDAGP